MRIRNGFAYALVLGTNTTMASRLSRIQIPRRSKSASPFPFFYFELTGEDHSFGYLLFRGSNPLSSHQHSLVPLLNLCNRTQIRFQQTNPPIILQRRLTHPTPYRRHRRSPPSRLPQNSRLLRETQSSILRHGFPRHRPNCHDCIISHVDSTIV